MMGQMQAAARLESRVRCRLLAIMHCHCPRDMTKAFCRIMLFLHHAGSSPLLQRSCVCAVLYCAIVAAQHGDAAAGKKL